MAKTVQTNKSPTSRIEVGAMVLAATKQLDTKPVKPDLDGFAKRHAAYVAAEARVQKAAAAKRAQEEKIGELDGDQDRLVAQLGNELIGDGLPKGNPFKPFGADLPPPSKLQALGYGAEAKVVHQLVRAVKKRAGLSKRTLETAAKLDKAATAVEAALPPTKALLAALTAAVHEREGLAQSWETAFATLKTSTRLADQRNGTKLFAALFQSAPQKARRPTTAKAAAKTAKTTTPATPPPTPPTT